MTVWEAVERGEYVLIALAVMLIAIIWIFIYRLNVIKRPSKESQKLLLSKVKDYVTEGDLDNAVGICLLSGTPLGKVLGSGLAHVGRPFSEIYRAMLNETDIQKQLYLAGLSWLKYLAATAPLIGAGGTLIGICDGFRNIADDGFVADLNSIAGSIAPTLPTIVGGLCVGVVALFAMAFLESGINRAINRLLDVQKDLTEILNQPG